MKYLKYLALAGFSVAALLLLISQEPVQPAKATGTELLTNGAWHLTGNNGAAQAYQPVAANALNGMASITITYDLNGLCALGNDASAIIFDQNGWKYISLNAYGQNCYDGTQTVTIPLSNFPNLNLNANLTGNPPYLHTRFWYGSAFSVDITSIVANPANTAPTITSLSNSPTTTPITEAVIFTASATDDGSIASYSWNFGDGVTATSTVGTTTTITHAYAATGTYTTTLTVTDNLGATATSSVVTTVRAYIPTWNVQSVDVMKYTKDNICSQSSTSTINSQLDKIVEVGAQYVKLHGYYDNPSCANATAYLTKWAVLARAKNLKIWWGMKDLSFEGDYSVTKATSPDNMRHQKKMVDWITINGPTLIQNDDRFTPFAEVQNGGINGVNSCGSVCQFSSKADFNLWLRQTHTMADLALKAIGKTNVPVGYYGFDGFIVAGLGNAFWQGQSQLEPATIALMGNVTMDHYPEAIGHTLAQDMPTIRQAVGTTTPLFIGEYGTITTSSSTVAVSQLSAFLQTAADPSNNIQGFNYWHLGPGGNEAIVNGDYTSKPTFDVLKSYFKK